MSKVLSKMLNESELVVSSMLDKLEALSGFESQDIRLLDEIAETIRQKSASLGLDPKDTTPEELFYGLKHRYEKDAESVEKLYGINESKRLKTLARVAESAQGPREVWVLKSSVAKKILRSNPPRNLMNSLGYRSLESMLKHEKPELLLAGALSVGVGAWSEKLQQQYSKLTPLDFENKPPRVLIPETKKWQQALPSERSASSVPQLGTVVIWDNPATKKISSLSLLYISLQSLENMYKTGLVLRSYQTERHFGSHVQKIWTSQIPFSASIGGIGLQWRSLLHHLAKQPYEFFPETFDPYILPEHLATSSASSLLAAIHPQLNWWRGGDYALLGQGKRQTSLNPVDVAINDAKKSDFGNHSVSVARQSLWDELTSRYMENANVFDKIISEIETRSSPLAVARVRAASV